MAAGQRSEVQDEQFFTIVAAVGVVGLLLAVLTASSGHPDAMTSAYGLGGGGAVVFIIGIIGILAIEPRRKD